MFLLIKDIKQTQEYSICINMCMLFVCVNLFSHSLVDGCLNYFQFYSVTKHVSYKHFYMYLLVYISSHDVRAHLC